MIMTARFFRFLFLISFVMLLAACAQTAFSPTETPPTATPQPEPTPTPDPLELEGWELLWQDEFEGDTINPEYWVFDLGGNGWGNNEWQYYTNRPENARIEDGMLVIEAHEEKYSGRSYTSARLKTQGLQAFTYGRVEARMKLPAGKGIWPAFWMLGEDIYSKGWPACGEIDIMENIGDPRTSYGTIHGPGYSGGGGIGNPYAVSAPLLDEEFHVFSIEWEPTEIRWFVDDDLFFKVASHSVPGKWVFDHGFFIILNLAVGGNWPGYPDETTSFPQQYLIDYVRVYQDPDLNLDELGSGAVHVSDISLEVNEVAGQKQVVAYVTVLDQDNQPVEGVVVTAGWLGVITGADKTASTNAEGIAGPFTAKDSPISKTLSFCVIDIAGGQYNYASDQNLVNCREIEP